MSKELKKIDLTDNEDPHETFHIALYAACIEKLKFKSRILFTLQKR